MKAYLESIATDNDWLFIHARADYLQYDQEDTNDPSNLTDGQVFIGLDPVNDRHNISPQYGTRQGLRWTGRFMILMRSEIDESYEDKFDNYISTVDEHLKTIEKALACQGLTLNSWQPTDIINGLFENLDGKVVTFDVSKDADKGETPNRLTTLTLSSNSETVASGVEITQIDITTDQDAVVTLEGVHAGLTLTKNNSKSWKITGSTVSALSFAVQARGVFGGYKADAVDIDISGVATPVTGLTYSNDEQTIYEETGDGSLNTLTPTTTPEAATGTYSSSDIPNGLSIDSSTGLITVDTYADIPSGVNTFTVTFNASGDYSGTADYEVTLTKKVVWTPADGLDGGSVAVGFDFGENVTSASNLISSVGSEYGESINATQSTDDAKPVVGTMANGKVCAVFTGDNALEITLSGALTQRFDIWIGAEAAFYSSFGHFIGNGVNENLNFLATLQRAAIVVNGTSVNMNDFSDEVKAAINCKPCVYHAKVLSENFEINLDAGETMAATGGTTNTSGWGANLAIGARATNGGLGLATNIGILVITEGNITSDDIDRLEGWIAYMIGSQSKLPAAHPFKTTPYLL